MPLREGIDCGNAKAGAEFSFRGEERLEYTSPDLRRDPGPIVDDFGPRSSIGCTRAHGDFAFSLKRIERIEYQIHDGGHAIGGADQGGGGRAPFPAQVHLFQSWAAQRPRLPQP